MAQPDPFLGARSKERSIPRNGSSVRTYPAWKRLGVHLQPYLVFGEIELLQANREREKRGHPFRLAVVDADAAQQQRPQVQGGAQCAAEGVEARAAALAEGVAGQGVPAGPGCGGEASMKAGTATNLCPDPARRDAHQKARGCLH